MKHLDVTLEYIFGSFWLVLSWKSGQSLTKLSLRIKSCLLGPIASGAIVGFFFIFPVIHVMKTGRWNMPLKLQVHNLSCFSSFLMLRASLLLQCWCHGTFNRTRFLSFPGCSGGQNLAASTVCPISWLYSIPPGKGSVLCIQGMLTSCFPIWPRYEYFFSFLYVFLQLSRAST